MSFVKALDMVKLSEIDLRIPHAFVGFLPQIIQIRVLFQMEKCQPGIEPRPFDLISYFQSLTHFVHLQEADYIH